MYIRIYRYIMIHIYIYIQYSIIRSRSSSSLCEFSCPISPLFTIHKGLGAGRSTSAWNTCWGCSEAWWWYSWPAPHQTQQNKRILQQWILGVSPPLQWWKIVGWSWFFYTCYVLVSQLWASSSFFRVCLLVLGPWAKPLGFSAKHNWLRHFSIPRSPLSQLIRTVGSFPLSIIRGRKKTAIYLIVDCEPQITKSCLGRGIRNWCLKSQLLRSEELFMKTRPSTEVSLSLNLFPVGANSKRTTYRQQK